MSSPTFTTASGLRARTVLVADHCESVRKYLRFVLVQMGLRVLEASNAQEAYQQCLQYPGEVELLVADVNMPRMDSRPLPDLLAAHQPEMRFVFTDSMSGTQVAANGDDICLMKPFSATTFAECTKTLLNVEPIAAQSSAGESA